MISPLQRILDFLFFISNQHWFLIAMHLFNDTPTIFIVEFSHLASCFYLSLSFRQQFIKINPIKLLVCIT